MSIPHQATNDWTVFDISRDGNMGKFLGNSPNFRANHHRVNFEIWQLRLKRTTSSTTNSTTPQRQRGNSTHQPQD
jgi:hypothetical protein